MMANERRQLARDRNIARQIVDYAGANFYFCCDGCKVTFDADPGKYAAIQTNLATTALSKTIP